MTVKRRTRAGTWSVFERRYKPIEGADGSIQRHWNDPEILAADIRYVWTIVEAEGKFYVVPGFHTVNYHARVLCAEPWCDVEYMNPGYLW